ncbi:MAG: metal-sensitive transcriptional regulator [Microcoleaceae cyanobacterium]
MIISDQEKNEQQHDREQPESKYVNHDHSSTHAHVHVHSEESLQRLVNRLSRIEGHVRGIKTMIKDSRPCPDILIQIAAVRGALDRVARMVLDSHLSDCISRASQDGDIDVEIEALKSALDRFLP